MIFWGGGRASRTFACRAGMRNYIHYDITLLYTPAIMLLYGMLTFLQGMQTLRLSQKNNFQVSGSISF